LGEFSPLGQQLSLGSFMKIAEKSKVFLARFWRRKSCVLILTKSELGYTLGDFFANSSGHPDRNLHYVVCY
jgi:hypothetical protein